MNNNRTGGRSRSRRQSSNSFSDHFGRRPRHSDRRHNFQRGSRGRRFSPSLEPIDYSKYVKKAVEVKEEVYRPKHKFEDFDIHPKLKKNITQIGFRVPTAIQDQAIPEVLAEHDVVGLADTGTGKTASFLIPLIHKTLKAGSQNFMQTLIIVPTRELAMQVEEEFMKMAQGTRVFSACLVGGMDMRRQIKRLSKPNQFLIGTPGRLVDLVKRKVLDLSKTQNVVLDEVDRMLDMGFLEDVTFLIDRLPSQKQSLFFSATMDKTIEPVMRKIMVDPVTVSVKKGNTSDNVEQDIIHVERGVRKVDLLHDLLVKDELSKVLIFCQTKRGVENLYEDLKARGFKAESIHGDKTQGRRKMALEKFKSGRADILIATDVAARGIDVQNITHVINYEIPPNYQDYVHRIGRTGRAGKKGIAWTFVG